MNRSSVIILTLCLSVQVSNQSSPLQKLTQQDKMLYESGITLYSAGCGDISRGDLIDKSKCILALTRLKRVVSENPQLVDAQIKLAELFYYQPSQMHWGEDSMRARDENLKLGFKHLQKALEFDDKNKVAHELMEKYKLTYKTSRTAGREKDLNDTL